MTVLPTRWWQKPAGIDMEQNYVTVTLCIAVIVITNAIHRTKGPNNSSQKYQETLQKKNKETYRHQGILISIKDNTTWHT